MRSKLLIIIAALIAAGFLAFAVTRTVRFTENAVVATFGRATEASVVSKPGLIFRWPAPVQSVTVYDTRARLLTTKSETQQTADNRQIIVQAFLTWRVADPLRFYQRFGGEGSEERLHYAAAENALRSQLRSAISEVSRYKLAELFTTQQGASKLPQLEAAILDHLTSAGASTGGAGGARVAEWGIEPILVGIDRIVLPEDTTKSVFDRMKATQDRLASEAQSRGEARASAIKAAAEAAASRILSFAQARAQEIRVKGDEEAAQYYATLATDSELAVFLEQIQFLKDLITRQPTLILPTTMPGLSVFSPAVLGQLGANGLPPFNAGEKGPATAVAPTDPGRGEPKPGGGGR